MPSTRNIRRRIRSVKNTSQITKAMQTVAASKMRKAQTAAINGRPFADLAARILAHAAQSLEDDYSHPLLEKRSGPKRAVIVIGTDKGLCGALNANLFREVSRLDKDHTLFLTAGRKASQFVARTRRQLVAEFSYGDAPTFTDAQAIARAAQDLFLKGEVDAVDVMFPRFVNTLTQTPTTRPLLPMERLWENGDAVVEAKGGNGAAPDYLFEPNAAEVMGALLRYFLDFQILQLLQETKASEQSARMVAMKNATENANQLIKDLTLAYNKIRQAGITTELLDISTAQLAIS
ncbi:MAG: ATP synthase F1 subunit gamma [Verrucomicrobiales bacterium]|nr:ATP synthase F1 subunit gamma [Verrucomicrobiales bacterium]MCP5525921.1 ATP synthase F1 subunit gamma [Verrucomicrobiales bacterium]